MLIAFMAVLSTNALVHDTRIVADLFCIVGLHTVNNELMPYCRTFPYIFIIVYYL